MKTKSSSGELGSLSIVATPIGNLSDMTYRAVAVLSSVEMILCEDTRTTKKLLDHYEIKNATMSFHSHSKLNKVEQIKTMIRDGKNLALVSDAGTPCISDPGVMLIAELRAAFGDELNIVPIPGASALITALSVSGLPAHEFVWKGFVPHKKGRATFFADIAKTDTTVIFYESVHRFIKMLESLAEIIPDRHMVIAREITKMFEEIKQGTVTEVLEYYTNHPDKVRGEFVIMVGPISSAHSKIEE